MSQASGFDSLVKAAQNSPKEAAMLMIADKLPEIVEKQVEAIKNIKIDKITVWDSNGGGNGEGTSTANFMSGMLKSLPPLQDVFTQAGLELPGFLQGKGEAKEAREIKASAPEKKTAPKKEAKPSDDKKDDQAK